MSGQNLPKTTTIAAWGLVQPKHLFLRRAALRARNDPFGRNRLDESSCFRRLFDQVSDRERCRRLTKGNQPMDTIPVIALASDPDGKSMFSDARERILAEVNTEVLSNSFSALMSQAQKIFKIAEPSTGDVSVKEITLSLEIAASGEIRLIGGVGVEVSGGIQVKLTRNA